MTDVIFHPCRECGKSFPRTGTKGTVHCMFCGALHRFFSEPDLKKNMAPSSEGVASFPSPVKTYLFLCLECNLYKSASYKAPCDECKNRNVKSSENKSANLEAIRYKDKVVVSTSNRYEGEGTKYIPNAKKRISAPEEDGGWLPLMIGAFLVLCFIVQVLTWAGIIGRNPDCPAYLDACGPDPGAWESSFPTL